MKNRVENLFLTKIRATFVLSNVGFPTLIDLTNLTREIPCREARVSSFMYGREPPPGGAGFPPGLRVLRPGRGFCAGAAGSYLLYNRRRSLHGALPEGRRTGPFQTGRTNPLPGRGANPFRTEAPDPFAGREAYGPFSNRTHESFAEEGSQSVSDRGTRPLCRRGGAHGSFANRVHGALPEGRGTGPLQTGRTDPLPAWRTVRKAPKGRGGRHSPQGAKEKSVFTRKIRYFFLFLHQLGK